MSEREELKGLVEEVLEHLRFYRELGVTELQLAPESTAGATIGQPALADSPMPQKSAQTESVNPAPAQSRGRSVPLPALFTQPEAALNDPLPAPVETLDDIRRELGDCQRCKLAPTRTNIVFGEGHPRAALMFIGEGPGADEDKSGRPFVGRAGQLLTKMIESIGLTREQVYIANVVKSRPPENRTPERDEVATCLPFLLRQIAVIRPQLIVTLGNPATQALLDTSVGITRLRGSFHDYPHLPGIRVMPTYHPAYLLRSPDKKRETWEDLKKVRDLLSQLSS